jgi:hypothetical protein
MKKCLNLEYDVVLSFAGEDRNYVEKVASFLRKSGIKVFYDIYEEADLWGKDLYQHLDDVYQNKGKYAVLFISGFYAKKLWANHELRSAQARAFCNNEEYILPAKFDDTEIPGIRETVGYIDLRSRKPTQLAKLIIEKLGTIEPEDFLPDSFKYIEDAIPKFMPNLEKEEIEVSIYYVFRFLKQLTDKERSFLAVFFLHGCRHDITEDIHQDITYIERVTSLNRTELINILNGLTNLGFEYKIVKSQEGCVSDGNLRDYELLSIKLESRNLALELENLTVIWALMYFGAVKGKCEECSMKTLQRLDFSDIKEHADLDDFDSISSDNLESGEMEDLPF